MLWSLIIIIGSSAKLIKEKLDEGIDVILEIDWQGARQVKNKYA